MGKKSKKNRFNQSVDVAVVYSSNTIAEVDPTDNLAELNLSKEKAEELQKIRAQLPAFTQVYSLDAELAKLPRDKPFRAFVHNMAFSATESDISKFFAPLEITNINLVGSGSGFRGFCFVDFATREDLAKALEKNDCPLAGRPVNVRIADPNTNDRGGGSGGGSYGRGGDRSGFGGQRRTNPGGYMGRSRGGYRPAALRDEFGDSPSTGSHGAGGSGGFGGGGGGGWHREGPIAHSSGPSHQFVSRAAEPRAPPSYSSGPAEPSVDRPKLNILPRTAPIITSKDEPPRNPKIFGLAKPVDTASKDLLIGERLNQSTAGIR